MNNEDITDILIEALEVFLNHILYVRDVYPQQIFKKRRVYNTPIYASIFPPLNSYLYKVLRSARELQSKCELLFVQAVLYHDDLPLDERYTFHFTKEQMALSIPATDESHAVNDEFLLEFEEQLRTSLYKLAERLKALEKLPSGAKFKVLLQTTQAGFVRLSNDSHYQDFPWLRETVHTDAVKRAICLLPLTKLDAIGLQLNVEVN